jgi:hypothetical protein
MSQRTSSLSSAHEGEKFVKRAVLTRGDNPPEPSEDGDA